MNLEFEKNRKFSTQDIYDILAFAVDAAEDNGFMNSFVFNRAMYEYAAIIAFQEDKSELAAQVAQNINTAWDYMIENGYIEKLAKEYEDDMNNLADLGELWMKEYSDYVHSARGLLDSVKTISGDILSAAKAQLSQTAQDEGVSNLIQIAENWGMNNSLPEETESKKEENDSLFE